MPENDPNLMTVFTEALELTDLAARAAYLDSACKDDFALRRQVEALLAAIHGAGGVLESDSTGMLESIPSGTEGEPRASSPETRPPSPEVTEEQRPDSTITRTSSSAPADRRTGFLVGQVIGGRYTLLDVLGEGGMGTVYRASQTEPVKRQVALKLIRIGMDSRTVLARFDAERQALALMDHPNIARVYDGGTTAGGQPFFVMELVNGVPITAYCDRRRLSIRSRLELFVSVCQAVQHAHLKGIIHRDLKPSNVLVTEVDGRPAPKVIDFGVAKATEVSLTQESLADTGAIVGTPTHMSPEQADPSSMDIDTRTDIYALGVILYELLAGSPPIDANQFRRGAILEMLRMVREVDPPRPSTKVSTSEALPSIAACRDVEPAELKRALEGDLDWIVMKALEKDRARRYDTANAFVADVLRHLAYEPVLAAPPSRAYRLRKFVRRNRAAVVAACLVVLALVAGITGTTAGLIRAKLALAAEAKRVKERDDALGAAEEATGAANARADELKYQLGVSDMVLAGAAYDNRDMVRAAERLRNVPPGQRGWEWHYLKRLTRGGLFTLYGHTAGVSSVSFSPDGTGIVTGSDDDTARVWDARTGTPLLALTAHSDDVTSVAFSPDSTRIVTGSDDQTAKVWDARTGAVLLELKGHTARVRSVGFSPDGTRIVTGSDDETAKVWDARSGIAQVELKGHTEGVYRSGFSPDGTRIFTSGDDSTAKFWDARTGAVLLDLPASPSTFGMCNACYSPDGRRIVVCDGETAAVLDARTGAPLLQLKATQLVTSVAFSPDGTRIVTGSFGETAKVWNARSGTLICELQGHTDRVTSVAFSPDGARIVTGSEDETAKVWDAQSGVALPQLTGHNGLVTSVAFSPDGTRIVTGSEDQTAKVWDARSGAALLELEGHTDWVTSVAISPDGTRIVTGSHDETAKVWDARSGATLLELGGHTYWVTSVAFSPDGARILTGSEDDTARVWDAHSGATLLQLKGHTGGVTCVAFSPDGTRIATGSRDRTARVWDARSGVSLLEPKGRTDDVTCVAFSPDGTRFLAGTAHGLAQLWDVQTGTLLLELNGHTIHGMSFGMSATFSPDGTRIVAGYGLESATVWDARAGTPLHALKHPHGALTYAAFSPDGRRIVISNGYVAMVCDAGKGGPLLELTGHTAHVRSASFSPDSQRVVTSTEDNSATMWDVRTCLPLLELKGRAGEIWGAWFSQDGSRIITAHSGLAEATWDHWAGKAILSPDGSIDTALLSAGQFPASYDGLGVRAWDAQTGLEVTDEHIRTSPPPGHISADGRWFALPIGKYVELIRAQPDEEEISYRRRLMQPNYERYREGYRAATAANDQFAAQFYLKLFSQSERPLIRAEPVVAALFDRVLLRDDVLASLKSEFAADPELRAACLKLARTWPESAHGCNSRSWALVRELGRSQADYERGLNLARAACQLQPERGAYLSTLGVAQYRCGLMPEALATLTRSSNLNKGRSLADLAFLALAQHRLGQSDRARESLDRLREVIKERSSGAGVEARGFVGEAETIELDQAFPPDPFAR
jgi:WD40 repeat protein/serine/threonine protein kinase